MPRKYEGSDDTVLDAGLQWKARGLETANSMLAAASLVRTAKLVSGNIEDLLKPFGITLPRYAVLTWLYTTTAGTMTLGDIAKNLILHPTSVTSAIDRLERDGLVERKAHPTDRRAIHAHITTKGRRLVEKASPVLIANGYGFDDMSDRVLKEVILMLRNVRHLLSEVVDDEAKYVTLIKENRGASVSSKA
jgi:DNA-binding MarR family transcriptional regulator